MAESLTYAVTAAEIVAATEVDFAVGSDEYEAVRDCSGFEDVSRCESCGRTFERGAGWLVFDGSGGVPICDADLVAWLTDATKSDALPTVLAVR